MVGPRFHLGFLLLAILGVFLLHDLWLQATRVEPLPYSEFRRLLDRETLDEAALKGWFEKVRETPGVTPAENVGVGPAKVYARVD